MPHQYQYLTTADVAERMGITAAAVAWRVRQGYITPAAKAPGPRGAFLYDPDHIDELVAGYQRNARAS